MITETFTKTLDGSFIADAAYLQCITKNNRPRVNPQYYINEEKAIKWNHYPLCD